MAIDTIKSTAVLDGAIATADIADDAVTADKLANAINTSIAAKAPIASPTFTGTTTANLLASNGTILGLQTNGTAVGGIGTLGGATYFGSQTSGIMFNGVNQNPTNGTSTRVDNTNDLGAQSYRYKNLYLGGGVFLGGTSTPNKLDDYEEGTIDTTNLTFTVSGSATTTANYRTLRYTKVGSIVTITGNIYLASVTSQSGFLKIPLPFVNASTEKNRTCGPVANPQNNIPTLVIVDQGQTFGRLISSQSFTVVTVGAGHTYVINLSYHTNA